MSKTKFENQRALVVHGLGGHACFLATEGEGWEMLFEFCESRDPEEAIAYYRNEIAAITAALPCLATWEGTIESGSVLVDHEHDQYEPDVDACGEWRLATPDDLAAFGVDLFGKGPPEDDSTRRALMSLLAGVRALDPLRRIAESVLGGDVAEAPPAPDRQFVTVLDVNDVHFRPRHVWAAEEALLAHFEGQFAGYPEEARAQVRPSLEVTEGELRIYLPEGARMSAGWLGEWAEAARRAFQESLGASS